MRNLPKYVLVVVFFAFVFFSSVGIFSPDMAMISDGQMSSKCPFMPGMASLCQMNPLEHIAAWQSMFAAIPNQHDVLTTLLLLLASFAFSLFLTRKANYPPIISDSKAQFVYNWTRTPITNPLQELFSSGILNSKIF